MTGDQDPEPTPDRGFWRHARRLFVERAKILASVVVDSLLLACLASITLILGKFLAALHLTGFDLIVVRTLQTIFATLTIGITLAMLVRDLVAAFTRDLEDKDG